MMESFFGILKTEMFYGFEKNFKSLDQLEQAKKQHRTRELTGRKK